MTNALTPTSWFYSINSHTPESQNNPDYPLRLEDSSFLDSGASIFVLNYLTYITIAKLLYITNNNTTHFFLQNTNSC